jgi:hypothetical protein
MKFVKVGDDVFIGGPLLELFLGRKVPGLGQPAKP